jgi:molybdate transport system ATP-binding protein
MNLEIRRLSLQLPQFTLEVAINLRQTRTAIFGPSGAGKTTLLEVLAGLRKPQDAQIRLNQQLFEDTTRKFSLPIQERQIGYVPQFDSLFPHLSVRRNLLYGSHRSTGTESLSLEHVTAFLQIDPLLDRNVKALSRGENQRVVIARALLSQPRLLLLDEPLTALDAKLKEAILIKLEALPGEFGIPILYVTHDPSEAIRLCEEVITLEAGKITGRGAPGEILK